MCFSPEASFAAAAVLGAAGAAGLAQKPERAHLAFAMFPLFFAAHQAVEGLIWLSFEAGQAPPDALIFAYLFIAKVFWPAYAPFTALLMERARPRRLALFILLVLGLAVSATLASPLLEHDYSARIVRRSIRYAAGEHPFGAAMIGLYVLTVVAPLLIARHFWVNAFGVVVFIGGAATALAFNYASASVWCFFAALASLTVFLHIRRQPRPAR